jgi:hypothetical protein
MEDTAMQSLTDYPGHWLERAQNADHLAKEMDDPETKRGMQGVADAYKRMAQRAAWRRGQAPTPESLKPLIPA